MSARRMFLSGFVAAFAVLGMVGASVFAYEQFALPARAGQAPVFSVAPVDLGAQKVVYHVATRGGWRDREAEAWRLISIANNHFKAVEPAPLDLRIVFQGEGVDALQRAKANPKLAAAFDALKQRGAKLEICANTLRAYHLGLDDLYDVAEADLVPAAVAEFVRLQQQGFSYVKF